MITKHEEIYYTNSVNLYGRFASEEEAAQDEKLKTECKYKVKTILPNVYLDSFGNGIEGINNYGEPYTGQCQNGKTKVYLFKDLILDFEKAIKQYGDNIGYTYQHFGMGQFRNAIVLLEENKL